MVSVCVVSQQYRVSGHPDSEKGAQEKVRNNRLTFSSATTREDEGHDALSPRILGKTFSPFEPEPQEVT